MVKIYKLVVVLSILVVCFNDNYGQGPPAGFAFSATITDSLATPVRMAIDNMDNIYVTDAYDKLIRKYNSAGSFTGSIMTGGSPISIAINDANTLFFGDGVTGKIFRVNSNGTTAEIYSGAAFPSSMVFGSNGNLYISDSKLKRITVINISGNLIRTIGEGVLTYPTGITFDKKNNRILVAEHGGIGDGFTPVVKIRIYDLAGNLITSFGSNGNGDGKFYRIQGLAVGRCGEIYVPEPYQGNVSVFNENTIFATRFAHYGDSISQLRVPLDIAINSADKIFITAENNGKIEIFNINYLLPTSAINCGNKTICAGTTTQIPVHFTGRAPWTFTYTIDGTNPVTISSTSDNPYLITASAPGNYQVTALSDSSLAGTCFSGNSVITVNNTIPTSTISVQNAAFCSGQSVDIPVVLTGIAPWTFTYTNNGASPQTVSNILASPYLLNISAPGDYQVTALSGAGCPGSTFTGNTIITENPLPTAAIATGNTSICEGDSTSIAIAFTGNAPWSFTYYINEDNAVTVYNITDNPYLLNVTQAGKYRITHVQDAFCIGNASAGSHEISIRSLPTSNIISANSSVCVGNSTTIIIDFTGTAPWNFTYTRDGLNPAAVTGVTATPYLLPVSLAGNYQVTALSDAGCTGTVFSGASDLIVNPLPLVDLGPAASICQGDSTLLDPGAFVLYLWNDSSVNRTLTAYNAGIYNVTVTDYNGCVNSSSKTLTPLTAPTSAITSGNAGICKGETTDITIVLAGTPPWNFIYTIDGINPATVSNVMSSPYLLNVYKEGAYHIIETADALCRSALSAGSATITVHPVPAYNFSSGNGSACAGQPTSILVDLTGTAPWNLTYTVNESNPVTLTGITDNPFILPAAHGGTYEITAISDAFCTGPGHNGTVTITEKPLPVVNLGNDVSLTTGGPVTLDAGSPFAGYLWSDGSTGQTLQVTSAGIYSVTATDYNGCSNSDAINVTTPGIPATRDLQNVVVTGNPCYSATQTITLAGGGTTFVVKNGGGATLIAGQNIVGLPGLSVDPGGYLHAYITTTNTFCGSIPPPLAAVISNDDPVISPVLSPGPETMLKLYPNPSTGLITLEISNPGMVKAGVEIIDMAGRHIYARVFENMHIREQVDLGRFPGGFYMVKFTAANITKITKLVLID